MNRTKINDNATELRAGGKAFYMAIIADMQAEHAKELAEKDKTIAYYAKTAELATQRKKQAIRNAERRAKLNLSYAALLLAGMMTIPWLFWFVDFAAKEFWLWGNGR